MSVMFEEQVPVEPEDGGEFVDIEEAGEDGEEVSLAERESGHHLESQPDQGSDAGLDRTLPKPL